MRASPPTAAARAPFASTFSTSIPPIFFDQISQKTHVGFDFLSPSKHAEFNMILKEVEFDADTDKRERDHDGVVTQVVEPVENSFFL